MAVVRLSGELVDAVINNAKQLFQKRLQAAQDSIPDVGDEIAQAVTDPFMPHINALPKTFLHTWSDRLQLVSIGGTKYEVSFTLSREYPVPRDWVTTPDGSKFDSGYHMIVKLADSPKYAHIKQQLDARQATIDAILRERDAFVSGVRKVLDAHSTLAPALKAWPPLWDLVPENFKERHRKVVERTKPEAAEIDVDLTKLTSTVVASKLAK